MILAVRRAACFSPNSVEKDAAILECVCDRLRKRGRDVITVSEEHLETDARAAVFVSMGRSDESLKILEKKEAEGALVVNNPASVALCGNRRRLTDILRAGGISVPAEEGDRGVWLKRADGTAQTALDVCHAADDKERKTIERRMREAGITDIMTCAHIEGDLVKFYGVRHTDFFSTHYPTDDGLWKFGDEQRNGEAKHYKYDTKELHRMADEAARLTGLTVYGGDCIISADGGITIIDFNDWPSFSRCREEAAAAIAELIYSKLRKA